MCDGSGLGEISVVCYKQSIPYSPTLQVCACVRACVHVCIPMYVYGIIWPKSPKRIFLEHFNLSIKIKLFTIFALSAGFLLTKKSTLEIQVKRNP